jgi:hypothetical protein
MKKSKITEQSRIAGDFLTKFGYLDTAPFVTDDRIIGPFDRILLKRQRFQDNGASFSRLLERREK